MYLKTIAAIFLLPVTFVLLTSCGPTEGERQRHEIARQDSLAKIRADSIAMAFNQNIDQAVDIRSLMEQSKKPADGEKVSVALALEQPPADADDTRHSEKPAVRVEQQRQAEARAEVPVASLPPARPSVQQQKPAPVATTAQPRRSDTAVVAVNLMEELAPSVNGGRYTVQLGTWRNEHLAQAEIEKLREWGLTNTRLIRLADNRNDGLFYIIRMGRYDDLVTARQQANYLNMEFNRQAVVIDLSPSS